MTALHQFNIGLHVVFGILALLVGLGPLFTTRAPVAHRRFGRWFLRLAGVVLTTAVLGLAVFNFRPFLAVIVLLSVYQAFAGYRTLRIRAAGPRWYDGLAATLFLAGGLVFLACLPRIRLVWSPVVMYSTLGALLAITGYDLGRHAWAGRWRRSQAWRYEHIWKMLSTYSALASAFSGTVLAAYQPYSQFIPSVVGTGLALGFMWQVYRGQRQPQPAAALA
jgi:hypothetical protein